MAIETAIPDDFDPDKTSPDYDPCGEGRHHVAVVSVNENGKNGSVIVDFEVLASSGAGNEGKTHREFFSTKYTAMWKLLRFAMAVGIITAEEIKQMKERGENPVLDLENDAVGKQLHIKTTTDNYDPTRPRQTCGSSIFHLADERCRDWPKHEEFAKAAGVTVTEKSKAARNSDQPNAAPAEPPQAIADDFLDGVV